MSQLKYGAIQVEQVKWKQGSWNARIQKVEQIDVPARMSESFRTNERKFFNG